MTYLKKTFLYLCILSILLPSIAFAGPFTLPSSALAPYTLQLEATVSESPVSITLEWPQEAGVSSYEVYRKAKDATSWGSILATVPFNAGSNPYTYVDTNVTVGVGYDYRVIKRNSGSPSVAYGYIHTGIKIPVVESRGKLVLVVDNTYQSSLASEITQLIADLTGDGYTVTTHYVARNATPASVKALIKETYDADPTNVKTVLLLGKVPVPYSGQLNPDGHANHLGAWPTDQYYADMSSDWTDVENWPNSSDSRQTNIARDGKFDQSSTPSPIDLQIGRIDLSGMTAFTGQTELQLLQQYLTKNTNYKRKVISPTKRGIIIDAFGVYGGEAFALGGWRNLSALVGSANITSSMPNYFNTLSSSSYQWTFAYGSGTSTSLSGLGTTANYVSNSPRSVFNVLFGSYFGDWEYTNSLLKAPLASAGWGLVSVWSGRPQWHLYHMALGDPIGYSTRLTQNNTTLFQSLEATRSYDGQVHVQLLGDPTLRTDVVTPVSNVTATGTGGTGVTVAWTASPDAGLTGYHVYRSTSQYGAYTKVTTDPVAGTSYNDTVPFAGGTFFYMVRAVKLESTISGSYYNQSIGVISSSVTIGQTNQAPSISGLSASQTIRFTQTLTLSATVADDELPSNTLTNTWSNVSGPTAAVFSSTSNTTTTVSFPQAGTYVLRLTTDDGSLSTTYDTTVIVSTDTTAPSTPSALTATNISESGARLSWTAATDDTAVTGYAISRNGTQIATTTNLFYQDTGLTPSTSYTYIVQAYDAATNTSAASATVSVTTSARVARSSGGGGGGSSSTNTTSTTVTQPVPQTTTQVAPKISLTKNLRQGTRNEEVRKLQQYLNQKGFVLALTGPGSPGKETTIFGAGTRAAVIRYQTFLKATTMPSMKVDGVVGPQLRAYINRQ